VFFTAAVGGGFLIDTHCCPVNSLSHRDAYRDVSGRAAHGAVAERVGERGSVRITA